MQSCGTAGQDVISEHAVPKPSALRGTEWPDAGRAGWASAVRCRAGREGTDNTPFYPGSSQRWGFNDVHLGIGWNIDQRLGSLAADVSFGVYSPLEIWCSSRGLHRVDHGGLACRLRERSFPHHTSVKFPPSHLPYHESRCALEWIRFLEQGEHSRSYRNLC